MAGCGCGKKVARPSGQAPVVQRQITGAASPVAKAQAYQSATMQRPPTGPVRKTV